jgi:fumarate reductase subunit D
MEEPKFTQEEIEEGRSAAILAYIPFLCFVPLLKWKDNHYAYSHARQGLALFILELIALILLIPGLAVLIVKVVLTVAIVLALIGIAFVLQDKEWKIPYLGDWIDRKVDERFRKEEEHFS